MSLPFWFSMGSVLTRSAAPPGKIFLTTAPLFRLPDIPNPNPAPSFRNSITCTWAQSLCSWNKKILGLKIKAGLGRVNPNSGWSCLHFYRWLFFHVKGVWWSLNFPNSAWTLRKPNSDFGWSPVNLNSSNIHLFRPWNYVLFATISFWNLNQTINWLICRKFKMLFLEGNGTN